MKHIQQLLDEKNRGVVSVAPGATVMEALALLAKYDIGALLVVDQGRLVGIYSERDHARKVSLQGRDPQATRVRDVMSEKVCFVSPSASVEECMALMTEGHFRHLPVMGPNQEVIGVLSIGDLVKETISQQAFIIDQLKQYISY